MLTIIPDKTEMNKFDYICFKYSHHTYVKLHCSNIKRPVQNISLSLYYTDIPA